jgi:hypothetical protein
MNKRQKKKFWKKFKTKKFSNIILETVYYLITPNVEKYPLIRKHLKRVHYGIHHVYTGKGKAYYNGYYYDNDKRLSLLKVKHREISSLYYRSEISNSRSVFPSSFELYTKFIASTKDIRYLVPSGSDAVYSLNNLAEPNYE